MKTLAVLSLGICLLTTLPASAASIEMICKNPRQEYLVSFDTGSRTLTVNPDTSATKYAPLAYERSASREAVAGMVGNGSNLGFYAEFRPKMRVELYDNAKLFEADSCRAAH